MAERFDALQADIEWRANTGTVSRDIEHLRRDFHQATNSMSTDTLRLAVAQQQLDRALLRHGQGSLQAARAELTLRRELEQTTRQAQRQAAAFDNSSGSLNRLLRGGLAGSGIMKGFGRSIAFASTSFLGGAGLVYALTSTLRIAGEFQRELNILQSVTGATAQQMERARDVAKELGRDVTLPATSAKDAAQAMSLLARAGLDLEDSMAGAQGVLRLAAAANTSVADSAKITARALAAFGLEGKDAAKVADVFAAAANASTAEIPELALGLQQASAVAKDWNLSLEDTVAVLALFANNAIIGSDAGTSLRVMLTRLTGVSKQARDSMEELGIDAFEKTTGKIKPFRQILVELHDVFSRLTPRAQKFYVQQIFGQDAQRAAGKAILDTINNYDKMRVAVDKASAAQQLAASRNRGYAGSVDAFKSSVETLQISLGTVLLPAFTDLFKAGTKWVNSMEESGDAARKLEAGIERVVTIAHVTAAAFTTVHDAVQPLIDILGGLDNTLAIVFAIGFARKLTKAAAGFGIIATSSSATTAKVVADAARMEAALDAATRPRVVSVTTTGTGVGGGLLGGLLGGPVGIGLSLAAGSWFYNSTKRNMQKQKWNALSAKEQWAYIREKADGDPKKMSQIAAALEAIGYEVKPQPTGYYKPGKGPQPGHVTAPATKPKPGGGGGGTTTNTRSELDIQIDLARAETTGGTGDDVRYLNELRSYYQRQIGNLEKRGSLTDKQKEDLQKLYQSLNTVQGQLDSIHDAAARDAKERAAEAKRRKQERDRAYREGLRATEQDFENRQSTADLAKNYDKERRILLQEIEFFRRQEHNQSLTVNERKAYEKKRIQAQKELAGLKKKEHTELKARLDSREQDLINNLRSAQLTKETTDDRKALEAEIAFYRKQSQNADLTEKERKRYAAKKLAAKKALKKLGAADADDNADVGETVHRLLSTLHGFQATYGSNVFQNDPSIGRVPGTGTTVHVHQTFPQPSRDLHREAIYARRGFERAMQAT